MHGHYSIPWPPVYLESWTQCDVTATLSVSVQCLYIGRTEELCSFCIVLYMGRNPHSSAELRVVYSTSILSLQV
jgi:hypothetical protein